MTDGGGVRLLPAVLAQLEEAGRLGFLGPRPVRSQAEHAVGFAAAWHAVAGDRDPAVACDLGSGGGVPGLVLATGCWPATSWTFLDAMVKRCIHLEGAVHALGLEERSTVVCGRAEILARVGTPLRASCDLVTSRGFGPPAMTAEAAACVLRIGGLLVVSEPPDTDGSRWDADGCARVGLEPVQVVRTEIAGFMVLRQVAEPDERFPRSPKAQKRSPLFHVEQTLTPSPGEGAPEPSSP